MLIPNQIFVITDYGLKSIYAVSNCWVLFDKIAELQKLLLINLSGLQVEKY